MSVEAVAAAIRAEVTRQWDESCERLYNDDLLVNNVDRVLDIEALAKVAIEALGVKS